MRGLSLLLVLALSGPGCHGDRGSDPQPVTPGLSWLLGQGDAAGFLQAGGERDFGFPADHGPHDGYRNEWWYLTGNLQSAAGRRFGYELTLFRFALAPDQDAGVTAGTAWSTHRLLIGHLALTDVEGGRFHVAERAARDAAGLAGAAIDPVRVWLYDWSLRRRPATDTQVAGSGIWQLQAADRDVQIVLTLVPEMPPVLQGVNGLSQKSADPDNASWYYSIPRLQTSGRLVLGEETFEVSGQSWLDREWSSSALAADQQGWDWFALQFDDGTNLMYYRLRKADGSIDPHSAGSLTKARTNDTERLGSTDVELDVLDTWDSPDGGTYPIEWQLRIPSAQLDLRIRPVMQAQELDTWVRYWEGAVDVSGTRGTAPINGRGYVEMTGYAKAEAP